GERALGSPQAAADKGAPEAGPAAGRRREPFPGDSLTARWTQVPDSAGTPRTKLNRVIARGSARSFTHLASQHDSAGPSLNYSRGKVIDCIRKGDKVDRCTVTGQANGVQLEP